MNRCRLVIVAASITLLFPGLRAGAQSDSQSQTFFSPAVAEKFYELAYELGHRPDANMADARQAFIFLTAATTLDTRANYVLPEMIRLTCMYPQENNSRLVMSLLTSYLDSSSELEVARTAVSYLLEQLNSRQDRQQLLDDIARTLGGRNPAFDSDIATHLALLAAEKPDLDAARNYLLAAYANNNYNRLAVDKLVELTEGQVNPVIYLEHLRYLLRENPLDLRVALAFAQNAQKLEVYDIAADGYKYCSELFRYLYPQQPLPPEIYLPWVLCSYNTQRNKHQCLKIAADIRQTGQFDLLLEVIAAKAAEKTGNLQQAQDILTAARDKALQMVSAVPADANISELPDANAGRETHFAASQLAWFFCIVQPDANQAVTWANKAFAAEPNSPVNAALLAYSLVMNGQADIAKSLTDGFPRTQLADLAAAQMALAAGEKDKAIETLKTAIQRDPATLEADLAKKLLADNGAEYLPPLDPESITTALTNTFGQAIVPPLTSPDKMFSLQFAFHGSRFQFASDVTATLTITNNWSEPLIISDNGLLTGLIRVDANITGDLSEKIPALLVTRVRPSAPIAPGSSYFVPLRLVTGRLRQILFTHPQASLKVEFTVWLDPVVDQTGSVANRLPDLKPLAYTVDRPGIELATKYLQNRLNALSKGQQGQKITTGQLFAGLLAEQYAFAGQTPGYHLVYADWMPAVLKNAVFTNLQDQDWVVRVHTLTLLPQLPTDFETASAVSKNLNDTDCWPARLVSAWLLGRNPAGDFKKVLDWLAKYDTNNLVRNMAVALGATPPKEPEPRTSPVPGPNTPETSGRITAEPSQQ